MDEKKEIIDDILTLEEAADYLKIGRQTIYKLARAGKLPAAKVGDLWRFDREALREWIKSGAKDLIETEIEGEEEQA